VVLCGGGASIFVEVVAAVNTRCLVFLFLVFVFFSSAATAAAYEAPRCIIVPRARFNRTPTPHLATLQLLDCV
jgi:hypothetical protein